MFLKRIFNKRKIVQIALHLTFNGLVRKLYCPHITRSFADKLRDYLRQITFRKDPDVIFSVAAITSVEVNKIILAISPDKAVGFDKIAACLLR